MNKRKRRLPKGVYLRGHTYWVGVSIDGKRIRKPGGKTLEEALLVLMELEEPKKKGQPRGPGRKYAPTLDRLVDRYLERAQLYSKPKSVQSAGQSCKRLLMYFSGRTVTTLNSTDIERFIAARLEQVSAEAVNRDLRYLKAVLRLALEEDRIEKMPVKIKLLRTTKKIPTILTPEEMVRLFDHAEERIRPMLMTASMTGLRHSELIALDWADIDFHNRILSVRAKPEIGFSPKSHAERQVPLNARLVETLKAHREGLVHNSSRAPVFQRNLQTASRWESAALCSAVRETFRSAGLYRREDRPGLHMLRRSFASHALGRETDIETVRELGGWSDLVVVQRYVASTDRLKRKAVDRLDFLEEGNS